MTQNNTVKEKIYNAQEEFPGIEKVLEYSNVEVKDLTLAHEGASGEIKKVVSVRHLKQKLFKIGFYGPLQNLDLKYTLGTIT